MGGRKYQTLDGLRGLAAFLVVLLHDHRYFGGAIFPISYLAVDLFFLMSGFVLAKSYEQRLVEGNLSLRGFMLTRAIRLYPLYLLGIALGICSLVIEHFVQPPGKQASSLYLAMALPFSLLMLPAPLAQMFPFNFPTWSLFYEMLVNAIYGAVARWLKTPSLVMVVVASGLLLAAYGLTHHGIDGGMLRKNIAVGFLRVLFSFFGGVLLYRFRPSREIQSSWMSLALVLMAGGLVCLPIPEALLGPYTVLVVLIAFPVIVWFSVLFEPRDSLAKMMTGSGLVSYAVYVLHGPFVIGVIVWIRSGGIKDDHRVELIGNLLIPLIIGVAFALDALYDQPVRKRLTKVWKEKLA